jgi:hypothetical protein
MKGIGEGALELKELQGSVIVCSEKLCVALELSNDTRGTYGDTTGPVGNFVVVDYKERRAFLGSTIEAWLQHRLGTSEQLSVLAVDVRERAPEE